MGNAHFVQFLLHGPGIAVVVQEGVGDNEGFPVALQLGQSHGQAAFFEIDLFRRAEPQHIFPPNGNSLDVQQMLDAYVFRDGVAAPAAAAQGQRGSEPEVVQVADAALRGGGVYQNPAGFHGVGEGVQLLLCACGIQVDRSGMAEAAVPHQPVGNAQSVFKVLCPVHGQYGGQLFVGEGLGKRCRGYFANEDLGVFRYIHAGHGGNGVGGLAYDLRVQRTVHQNGAPELFGLLGGEQMAASGSEFGPHGIVNAVQNHHALLGGTDHAIVKGLGVNHGGNGQQNVGGIVDDGGGVAGADAQSGLAGGIGGLYHAGTAGGQNQVRFPHQLIGQLQRGLLNPADQSFRRAGFHGCFQNNSGGGNGTLFCPGMGTDHNGIPGLQADERFEDCRRCGIRGGDDGGDDANGFGDPLNAEGFVCFDDAAGSGVFVGIVDVFGGIVVFDDLILHNAHSGLFHSHLCQGNPHFVGGDGGGLEDFIYLLLCVFRENALRLAAALQGGGEVGSGSGFVLVHSKDPFAANSELLINIYQ